LRDYRNLNERNYQRERRRTEIIMDLLDLKNATNLLDIGCGEGLQLEWIHKRYSHINLSGIDISEKRVERARERIPAANVIARSATVEGFGFETGSFDRAICSEVLEHLPQPEKVLINAYEVLKPGGLLVVSVPYVQKLVWVICMHCGKLTSDGHINSFDEAKITSILKDVGFKVISAQGYRMIWFPFVEKRLPYLWWKSLQKLFGSYLRRVRPYYLIALARK
jgi:ubiquinone/menaquinone biosynthesis C-methylase UbiE